MFFVKPVRQLDRYYRREEIFFFSIFNFGYFLRGNIACTCTVKEGWLGDAFAFSFSLTFFCHAKTRPYQFRSLKVLRSTLLREIKFVDRQILRLLNWEKCLVWKSRASISSTRVNGELISVLVFLANCGREREHLVSQAISHMPENKRLNTNLSTCIKTQCAIDSFLNFLTT